MADKSSLSRRYFLRAVKVKMVEVARKWDAHLDRFDVKGEKDRPLINT